MTVRRALDGLARDGLVRRAAGAGTFVAARVEQPAVTGDLANMLASLIAMGEATKVRLLSFSYGVPPAAVAGRLGLAPDEQTQQAVRVRLVEGKPLSYLMTHVPARIGRAFGEADLARTPLLTLLERNGAIAERAEQTVSATLAGPEAAAALGVEVGAPLISITRVILDAKRHGIEYLDALYRPDMYRIEMDLRRTGSGPESRWQHASSSTNLREPRPRARRRRPA